MGHTNALILFGYVMAHSDPAAPWQLEQDGLEAEFGRLLSIRSRKENEEKKEKAKEAKDDPQP